MLARLTQYESTGTPAAPLYDEVSAHNYMSAIDRSGRLIVARP